MAHYEIALMNFYPEPGEKPYMWKCLVPHLKKQGCDWVAMALSHNWVWKLSGEFSPYPEGDGEYVAIRWVE